MIAAALLIGAQASVASAADIRGSWVNERGTVIIRIADCPSGLCGEVVWSAPAAQGDAARGGIAELDGTMVISNFVPVSSQSWRVRLFLPDRNRTVRATTRMHGNDELVVRGCELGGLICKSQNWQRRSSQ
jgi:uncharacterized protein (DUF2147 family)